MNNLPNLLIVDDSEENLVFLESVIRKVQVNLIKALSGSEALDKTKGIELALAIIDVRMPVMSGYELAIRINEGRPGEKVPVIFLTASHINEIEVFKGYSSGAVDYIFKPVNNNILQCKINVFLDLFNQRQIILRDAALLKESADKLSQANLALKLSEEKYRGYIENAPDGVFIADETGKYVEVNDSACRITGYSKGELLNMSIWDLIPTELLEQATDDFGKVVKTGASQSDIMFRHKSGKMRWWAIQAVKLNDHRYLGFTEDITPRKEMEEALRLQQIELEMQNDELTLAKTRAEVVSQKYEELYDFAPSGYFTLNSKKEIKELNLSGARILGKNRSDLAGINFDLLIARNSREDFNQFFDAILKSKTKGTCEVVIERGAHQSIFVYIEGIVAGNGTECLINLVDVTARKYAEDALRKSEEVFRSVVNNSFDLTALTDADGRIIFISPQCESVIGYPGEKYLGKVFPDIIHPDDFEHCRNMWEAVLKEGKMIREFDYRIIDASGNVRWVSHSATLVRTNDSVVGIQNTIRNITERKIAEHTIKVSEEKYKTMLNASPDGILLINLNGIITEVSDIGLEIFGADSKTDLVGKNFLRFVLPDEISLIRNIAERTINEGLAQNVVIKVRKKTKVLFTSESSTTLIQGPDGTPLAFMIIIRDITHRKKMETKQMHSDRMASLGEMASGIAHEINQPLNIISMVMDKILFETAKTETIDIEFLKSKSNKIFENIIRIRNIIDHIRAFSKSHDDYVLTGFNINSSIENAVSMISEQFKHLGINLQLELDTQIPQILGNTFKFEQVIVNLLINAKDAVIERKTKQDGTFEMIVGIKSYVEDRYIVVEVNDNGIGISDEDINNVMLPFYTTKDQGKGTGLGLSICYQIIKEMDGTIEMASDKNCGTNIRLILNTEKNK